MSEQWPGRWRDIERMAYGAEEVRFREGAQPCGRCGEPKERHERWDEKLCCPGHGPHYLYVERQETR